MLDSLALSQLLNCSQRSGCRNVVVEDGVVDERSGQEVRFGTSVKAGLALLRKSIFTLKKGQKATKSSSKRSIQKGSHLSP